MRRVFGLGETVLDVIFKDGQPISAKAGGSVLNALVSLARMGHECYFISELGNDQVGDIIIQFLQDNNIHTDYIQRYDNGQSALALAFLDKNNDAEYDFYKNYPQERLSDLSPNFQKDDILLFGSSYAISPAIRKQIHNIAEHANKRDCIILYDPNFRKKHDTTKEQYLQYIKENFAFAGIVRGSNEDFENIYKASSSEQAFFNIQKQCDNLVYTANAQGVFMQSLKIQKHYPVPHLQPVSTIGAGDNFNAGIIHGILERNILKNDLSDLNEKEWDYLIRCGIEFSKEVCMSLDNYVAVGFNLTP
ncbi:PfkB family carbohydrate kinase [Saccharicrinis sp. 156]|uniref:PfkB family carbohydrate kinase n=1 Tax=Saccharicrinis sp. 156 TaxID=3417574 RepID=UPI003D356552